LPNKIFIGIGFYDEDITACWIEWFDEPFENQASLKSIITEKNEKRPFGDPKRPFLGH